jgi:uroporphyrinogen decarboxylase
MIDGPWGSTVARWRREGLPAGAGVGEFFGFDHVVGIGVDNSPRYPSRLIEETEEYTIRTSAWGATIRNWKHAASVPEFIDFTIKDRDTWEDAKARMTPTKDRINWKHLEGNYPKWREQGAWIQAGAWFGYDVFASWHVGTERVLMAMITDPDWCADMFNHALSVNLALLDMVWDAGYTFDCLSYPDDLGYRNGLFFSLDTYREVLKPAHKRSCDWAHEHGIKVMLHSCGNIMELIPDLIDAGFDGLNPLEIKAGMDPLKLKEEYDAQLVLEGGIDVRNMTDGIKIEEEIRTKIPALKAGGGYIYHSDHSVPDSVSFSDYCRVMELVRYYGKY